MKKKMKGRYVYSVKTEYGDTEIVRWDEVSGCWASESGRNYDESEFISFSKVKETENNLNDETEGEMMYE